MISHPFFNFCLFVPRVECTTQWRNNYNLEAQNGQSINHTKYLRRAVNTHSLTGIIPTPEIEQQEMRIIIAQ
jgi:hypothetical protein